MEEQLKYYPGDRGPFVVIITQVDNEKLNELRVAKILINDLKLANNNIIQIRSVRNGGVKVIVKNSKTANKILKADLNKLKLSATIPFNYLHSKGVIRNVPIEFTMDNIINDLECPVKIVALEREQRWCHTEKVAKPTESVIITFRSYELPRNVTMFGCHIRVLLYIPKPLLCQLCKMFGHTKKFCKSPTTCKQCFKIHDGACEEAQKRSCRYCIGHDHVTGQAKCPQTQLQRNIKTKMLRERLTFKDAHEAVKMEGEEYPGLPRQEQKQAFPKAQDRIQVWQNPRSIENLTARNEIL